MSARPRFRTGLYPWGIWLAALAIASLLCVGAAPWLGQAAAPQPALARLGVVCHGGAPASPRPAHPTGGAWLCQPPAVVSFPAVPPAGPATPAPRAAIAAADVAASSFRVTDGRVPDAALPRGPPGQPRA